MCDLAGAKPGHMHDVWTLKRLIEELKARACTDYPRPWSYAHRDTTCETIANKYDGLDAADQDALRVALREAYAEGAAHRTETPETTTPMNTERHGQHE